MVLILGVVFVLLYLVKTKLAILIVLSVFLVFANTIVFGAITYFGFKTEEIKDAKELASHSSFSTKTYPIFLMPATTCNLPLLAPMTKSPNFQSRLLIQVS